MTSICFIKVILTKYDFYLFYLPNTISICFTEVVRVLIVSELGNINVIEQYSLT